MKRLIIIFILLFMLSSCSFLPSNSNGNEIMQAPILTQMQKDIYDELDKVLGIDSIVFRYPAYKGQHSPFVFYDINNDDIEEVIIFYSFKTNKEELFAKIMVQNEQGKWHPFYDLPCFSNQINYIDFAPVTDKKESSILIGWAKDNKEYIGVYSMEKEGFNTDFIQQNNGYIAYDIDDDGAYELFLVVSEDNRFILKLYKITNGEAEVSLEAPLFKETARVHQMIIGDLKDGSKAVYIDEEIGGASTSYGTEIIKISPDKLEVIVGGQSLNGENNNSWEEFAKTFRREAAVLSIDLEKDGSIEVPSISDYNVFEQNYSDGSSAPRLIEYMELEGSELKIKYNTVHNQDFDYYVNLPERWLGNVLIVEQAERQEWRFYKINKADGLPGTELLRIRAIYSNENQDEISDDDFLLATKNLFKIYGYASETSGEELAVTRVEVENQMFGLL